MFMDAQKPFTVKTLREALENQPDDLPIELCMANIVGLMGDGIMAERQNKLKELKKERMFLSHAGGNANESFALLFGTKKEFSDF